MHEHGNGKGVCEFVFGAVDVGCKLRLVGALVGQVFEQGKVVGQRMLDCLRRDNFGHQGFAVCRQVPQDNIYLVAAHQLSVVILRQRQQLLLRPLKSNRDFYTLLHNNITTKRFEPSQWKDDVAELLSKTSMHCYGHNSSIKLVNGETHRGEVHLLHANEMIRHIAVEPRLIGYDQLIGRIML